MPLSFLLAVRCPSICPGQVGHLKLIKRALLQSTPSISGLGSFSLSFLCFIPSVRKAFLWGLAAHILSLPEMNHTAHVLWEKESKSFRFPPSLLHIQTCGKKYLPFFENPSNFRHHLKLKTAHAVALNHHFPLEPGNATLYEGKEINKHAIIDWDYKLRLQEKKRGRNNMNGGCKAKIFELLLLPMMLPPFF